MQEDEVFFIPRPIQVHSWEAVEAASRRYHEVTPASFFSTPPALIAAAAAAGGTAIALMAGSIPVHPGGPDPALDSLPHRGDVIADLTGLGLAAGVTVIGGLEAYRRWWRKGD